MADNGKKRSVSFEETVDEHSEEGIRRLIVTDNDFLEFKPRQTKTSRSFITITAEKELGQAFIEYVKKLEIPNANVNRLMEEQLQTKNNEITELQEQIKNLKEDNDRLNYDIGEKESIITNVYNLLKNEGTSIPSVLSTEERAPVSENQIYQKIDDNKTALLAEIEIRIERNKEVILENIPKSWHAPVTVFFEVMGFIVFILGVIYKIRKELEKKINEREQEQKEELKKNLDDMGHTLTKNSKVKIRF